MRSILPNSLAAYGLWLLAASSRVRLSGADPAWPYNLPSGTRYYPEDEALVQKNQEIASRLANSTPPSIRKMSGDPGEMFFLHYYGFGASADATDNSMPQLGPDSEYQMPMGLHSNASDDLMTRWIRRSLWKRDFKCPSGTSGCADIGRPNSCCPTGSTCNIVKDTGLGDVGCCADGSSCDGGVTGCPSGYSTCSDDQGGGCCLPGFACNGAGCVRISTTTVHPTTSAAPTTSTTTTTPPPPPPTTTSSKPSCTAGFKSCPASLGGGCCPTDRGTKRPQKSRRSASASSVLPLAPATTPFNAPEPASLAPSDSCPTTPSRTSAPRPHTETLLPPTSPSSMPAGPLPTLTSLVCGTSSLCIATSTSSSAAATTTAAAAPPVRGTSESSAPVTTPAGPCPSNFYACSAYYPGAGCCQIGRDCSSTSCPPRLSTSALVTDGVTIVVAPTGSAAAAQGGCANGWQTCAQAVGGGCCPDAYGCGSASCTLTGAAATASGAAASATVAKESAGQEAGGRRGLWVVAAGVALVLW